MYGMGTYIYHKNQTNVGKYTVPYMDGMGNSWKQTLKTILHKLPEPSRLRPSFS